jgi:hypothetical protein
MAIDTRYVKQPLMLGVIMSINASGMKDIIGFHITVSKPLALSSIKYSNLCKTQIHGR